jgi:hypothetical protein
MQQKAISPHKRARQVYFYRMPKVLALLLFQMFIRLVAFGPLLYAGVTGSFLGLETQLGLIIGSHFGQETLLAPICGLACSLPLYVLLVMPMRFQTAAYRISLLHDLPRESRINAHNYLRWLLAALLRLARALPFLLPFFAFIILYYYYIPYPDFIVPMLGISNLGDLIGQGFIDGVIIIGLAGVLSALLAAYGWKRDIPFEQQDVLKQGIRLSLKQARMLRRRRRRIINRTVSFNLLLCLPAVAGVLLALGSYLLSLPRSGMLAMDYLNMAITLIQLNLPEKTLIMIILVMAVLWLPVLPLRKLALSAATAGRPKQP